MTKPKERPATSLDAVEAALEREASKRKGALKPIEIVKVAISAYQAYSSALYQPVNPRRKPKAEPCVESQDRTGLRRGTQASVDRLLFNVNYWRAAYEDRIVAACTSPEDAAACLQAACAWNSHTMKLNTLPPEEVTAMFERFCPPPASNNRRGARGKGLGKGPVHDFRIKALEVAEREDAQHAAALRSIIADMEAEVQAYTALESARPLDALYVLLPAWCLQERIDLVCGSWWEEADIMLLVARKLRERFMQMGFGEALCDYFFDSYREALDSYQREVSAAESPLHGESIPQLIELVKAAREANPNSETDGYGTSLPGWLSPKEQLIWNTVVCAIYGPMHARPLLADDVSLLPTDGKPANADVITDLAQRAYLDYLSARRASGIAPEYGAFDLQPEDLRNSGLERIESIPAKLDVLGYRMVPAGSCYPDQRIYAFAPSEVECLAILEHRRWLTERQKAGWSYAPKKDVATKHSPYLVSWDELPDRVREWNRSTIRDLPTLLASVGLAIAR